MEKFNKKIIMILSLFVIIFVGFVLYMTYFQIVQAEEVANNEYNKRLWVDENKVSRGPIYDRKGDYLAETMKDSAGNNYRNYPGGIAFSNIVGYNSTKYGKNGLEKTYNNILLNISKDTPLSELRNIVQSTDKGNGLGLTIDSNVQQKAYDLLEGKKGSIVVMNPKTGAVYAMSSRPGFDPNTLDEDWEHLINNEDSPLLNRGTQGKYTPGSVFKVVTATSIMENKENLNLTMNDEGTITIDGYVIANYGKEYNGQTDLRKALVKSSNVYFAEKGVEVGGENMKNMANKYFIGQQIPFDLPQENSVNPFSDSMSKADLAAASFGQGKTLVTPLNMAMIMSAIANEGKMMKPYIVEKVISPEDESTKETETVVLSQITTAENANEILKDLKAVIDAGSQASLSNVSVAGKSGTAEIKNKTSTNSWFIATAPASNPKFAVAVVLEDDGTAGGTTAAPIAREILNSAINNIK